MCRHVCRGFRTSEQDFEALHGVLPEGMKAVGDVLPAIWKRFLREYGNVCCVCRFGDDLGFKSATLEPTEVKHED